MRSPGNAGGSEAWLMHNSVRMSYDRKKSPASSISDSHHSYQNPTFFSQFSSSSYLAAHWSPVHRTPPCPNPSSLQSIDSSHDPSLLRIPGSCTPLKSEMEQGRAKRVFIPVAHCLDLSFSLKASGAETSWTHSPRRHKTAIPTACGQEG